MKNLGEIIRTPIEESYRSKNKFWAAFETDLSLFPVTVRVKFNDDGKYVGLEVSSRAKSSMTMVKYQLEKWFEKLSKNDRLMKDLKNFGFKQSGNMMIASIDNFEVVDQIARGGHFK